MALVGDANGIKNAANGERKRGDESET